MATFTAGAGRDRAWVLRAIADEVLAELTELEADEQCAQMMLQAAVILQWVATGITPDTDDEFVRVMTGQAARPELASARD